MTDETALTVPNTSVTPTLADTMSLAQAFARSGFFQDATDAAQAIVKIQAGRELGIPPVASMTGVYIVKGRVTLSANILAALVKKHPAYDYRVFNHDDDNCTIEFYQDGDLLGQSEFTMEDAQKAGLANGQNWRSYPRNMLFARAMSNGVKWFCPDVMGGAPVYTPDELGREVGEDGGMRLFATPEQIGAIKERLIELFPDVQFQNDGHYNYILKRNGYPSLRDVTAEQADMLLQEWYHEGPDSAPEDGVIVQPPEPEQPREKLQGVGKDPAQLIEQGKAKMQEQPTTPDEDEPDLSAPTEWAEFWKRTVDDLGFTHKNHALNAFKQIFPHYDKDNMPAIADAWPLMIQHQQEAGRR